MIITDFSEATTLQIPRAEFNTLPLNYPIEPTYLGQRWKKQHGDEWLIAEYIEGGGVAWYKAEIVEITRGRIVEIALSWQNTPFGHQQSLKGVATDCEGYVEGVAVEAGFPEVVELMRNYRRREDGKLMLQLLRHYMDYITGSEEREPPDMSLVRIADVVAFCDEDLRQPDIPRHLGFITKRRHDRVFYVSHASEVGVRDHRMDLRWLKRIHSVWTFRGLAR